MKLNDKVYDVLKWIAILFMPTMAWAYDSLASIWGLPYPDEISKTINIVGTIIGVLIGVSTINYNKENAQIVIGAEGDE